MSELSQADQFDLLARIGLEPSTHRVLDIRVRELKAGDITLGSRQRIEQAAVNGVVTVSQVSSERHPRRTRWNPSTTMRIARPIGPQEGLTC